MDPSKFPASPAMPIFPVSPERAAGTKPPYNGPGSPTPSVSELRTSPIRMAHRRNDSDVSVHGLAAMFENLGVKDPREMQERYKKMIKDQKERHASAIKEMETKHLQALGRNEVRIDELNNELRRMKEALKDTFTRQQWDKLRNESREREHILQKELDKEHARRKQVEAKMQTLEADFYAEKTKSREYGSRWKTEHSEHLKTANHLSDVKVKLQATKRDLKRAEEKAEKQERVAETLTHKLFNLELEHNSMDASLREELKKMEEKVKLVEEERDALKTNLKEEEVLRIAAEGRIALPVATNDESDEFGSHVRSPSKPRETERDDDKENVAPRKSSFEFKMLHKDLQVEKRLRMQAEEQIEFMKMECQFQCCSCRIADLKGSSYIHDSTYLRDMERIKLTIPVMTPPASVDGTEESVKQEHEEDTPMADIPEMPISQARPFTPVEAKTEETPENVIAFSPSTGTFRAVPSPEKEAPKAPTPEPARPTTADGNAPSSPWAPPIESTVIRATASPPPFRPSVRQAVAKAHENMVIHEDVIEDNKDHAEAEPEEPQTPQHGPPGPAMNYFMRTITTTTTVPLHFSPETPLGKPTQALTPSTIAHLPSQPGPNVLGELNLNALPIDREAALEQIRQRRGRARSMAAGQGTPRKQMLDGVGLAGRRDISAPVSRVRR